MTYKYRTGEKDYSEYWRFGTIILLLATLSLAITLAVVVVLLSQEICAKNDIMEKSNRQTNASTTCGTGIDDEIDLSEPEIPSVFSDLTETELRQITEYLFSQADLNVQNISKATINSTYIHVIELLLPNKTETLIHLDNNTESPRRFAKVVLFRGDIEPPIVEEYRVGPLPNPTSHALLDYSQRRKNPVDFSVRPLTGVEIGTLRQTLFKEIYTKLAFIVYESFGILLSDCKNRCLDFVPTFVSTPKEGNQARQLIASFGFQTEFFTLHPIDLQVLMDIDGSNISEFKLSRLWYNQQQFDTVDQFIQRYSNDTISKITSTFPTKHQREFSTMNVRGDPLRKEKRRGPRQVEPDGKRYTVKSQQVEYLGWSFNYRMSTTTGPMLLDVKYRKNRIAYEISLQEIAVFYSGANPGTRFADYVDSIGLLGYSAKALVPGVDCPEHATLLPARHQTSSEESSVRYTSAFCIFEHNTGMPLRRHHSPTQRSGFFFSGMMTYVLILRTAVTIVNYDYILDFIFHPNGALEVKVALTGYILASVYSPNEEKYGFRVNDGILGNIHHHMFHFKVDLDINGPMNRFETLDIELEGADNSDWSADPSAPTYYQIMMNRNLKMTELGASYAFNFSTPKYLIFHNEDSKDKYGNPRAYRLSVKGISKQTLPEGKGHEPSISWSRYQVAVTKYHPREYTSSSVYAAYDAHDPVVNFQSYLENNETIVDEDLVAWVTLGTHHIPHSEDLPVTTTTANQLTFFLLPYNFFSEDPSMASRSAVRIDLNGTSEETQVNLNRYGQEAEVQCLPESTAAYDESIRKDKSQLFYD